jgi:tetratricopeptide (TPR) repeat protein
MRQFLTGLLMLLSTIVSAQKMPSDYFDEGVQYSDDHRYHEALASFQYIVENYPRNELYPRAFYNVGCLQLKLKNYEGAKTIFSAILKSNFNERENLGAGIMGDPFTNYRHHASELLSNIYFKRRAYDSALYFLSLSDTAYPFLHFCGNEIEDYEVNKAIQYANIYRKLNLPDSAIKKLLPVVFVDLVNNGAAIQTLGILLSHQANSKSELDTALNHIYTVIDSKK